MSEMVMKHIFVAEGHRLRQRQRFGSLLSLFCDRHFFKTSALPPLFSPSPDLPPPPPLPPLTPVQAAPSVRCGGSLRSADGTSANAPPPPLYHCSLRCQMPLRAALPQPSLPQPRWRSLHMPQSPPAVPRRHILLHVSSSSCSLRPPATSGLRPPATTAAAGRASWTLPQRRRRIAAKRCCACRSSGTCTTTSAAALPPTQLMPPLPPLLLSIPPARPNRRSRSGSRRRRRVDAAPGAHVGAGEWLWQ